MNKKRVVIIGGGLGGISAAISLQSSGFQAVLIEKNNHIGGKLHEVSLGSSRFDFGPNTITMPGVFNEVIKRSGQNPEDFFNFIKLTDHTTNSFYDHSSFTFSSNKEKMKEELLQIDPRSADNYEAYLNETSRLFHTAENHFLRRTFKSWKDYLSLPLMKALMTTRPLENLDHFHRRFFKDERILAAFNRYATYIGSSPYYSPATFGLIGHLELGDGVYYTMGGNYKIAEGMERAAELIGVEIMKGREVTSLEGADGKIKEVVIDNDNSLQADAVVLNGDLLTQFPRLVDEKNRPSFTNKKAAAADPSISAYVLLAASDRKFDLNHHHVFFSENPGAEFRSIFQEESYGIDPTIYICTSSKTEPAMSPRGDNMFFLINAPPLSKSGNQESISQEFVLKKMKSHGLDIAPSIIDSKTVTPADIKNKFYAYRGALYGISSNKRKNTFLRPYNKAVDFSNLYFTGGSTHPGGGSPMVTLSGMNVADLIYKEHR
ncbi:phytoene desaturase family protein [Alkalicoccus halolimnae]|uniref:4,4'-diaponeurosporene oxygenase n=1 Tax=Alkalicoccus halolimnae TaxID=1667239 RepID=A0A5C7F2T6_9BACI|nr:phytoene desaturase family protein [Alkalicoccus halolimnae]TXF83071.1 phytoene desaturase [Alkalicoccus halolimnae]